MIVVFPNGRSLSLWVDSKDGKVPMETVVMKELIPRPRGRDRVLQTVFGGDMDHFKAQIPWVLAEQNAAALPSPTTPKRPSTRSERPNGISTGARAGFREGGAYWARSCTVANWGRETRFEWVQAAV